MTEAPAVRATADVAIVKGKTPAGDRTWLTSPDGTARRAVVHVIGDLPHLIVESVFGLDDGLWGTLAQGGLAHAACAPGRRDGLIRLVTDSSPGGLCARNWPGHAVATAAVNAVLNRWGEGPDTPDGVRDRMRAASPQAADLADSLDDGAIRAAAAGVKLLYRAWRSLPVGGTLRLTWPLEG